MHSNVVASEINFPISKNIWGSLETKSPLYWDLPLSTNRRAGTRDFQNDWLRDAVGPPLPKNEWLRVLDDAPIQSHKTVVK